MACLVGIPIAGEILSSNGGDWGGLMLFTGMLYVGSLIALVAGKLAAVGWRFWAIF